MELFSQTAATIRQAARQASLMITLRVDHPDILDFIQVKNDSARRRVRFANISVRVSDAFLKAVGEGRGIPLWFARGEVQHRQEKPAALIWQYLARSAWACAEPGILFWDTITRESTTQYNGMEVYTTNPCSEITLEPYGACCLANVNLSQFVANEFTAHAALHWDRLGEALRFTVRFLDNVIDYNSDRHPLPEHTEASLRSRRIGVGFTGFADMLIKLGYQYGTSATVGFADGMFARIKNIVYDASADLADEKGSFPVYEYEKHIRCPFIERLDGEVRKKIRRTGLRNAALLTVPPVGSGSVLAGCSSGIEPLFGVVYTRRSTALSKNKFEVLHPLVRAYVKQRTPNSPSQLPASFVTAHQIHPVMRVRMQAAIQKHIDQAISSTINLPADASQDSVEQILWLAWQSGCKGITVYREGSREDILSVGVVQDQASTSTCVQPNGSAAGNACGSCSD